MKIIEGLADYDIRQAIEMLRMAAIKADKKIEEKHISLPEQRIGGIEGKILGLVKKPIDSGKLFELSGISSYSSFYRLLAKMESSGLIRTKEIKKGRGRSRIVEAL